MMIYQPEKAIIGALGSVLRRATRILRSDLLSSAVSCPSPRSRNTSSCDSWSLFLCCGVSQCITVCCSVLQCVAVCCSVLQCVAVSILPERFLPRLLVSVFGCGAVYNSVLQCVAVSCSKLRCVIVCCSVLPSRTSPVEAARSCTFLQCVAVFYSEELSCMQQGTFSLLWIISHVAMCCSMLQYVVVCFSMLQYVSVCCSVLQCVAVCCSVFQCVAVYCSILQCVAVCCSVLQCVPFFGIRPHKLCCHALQYVAVCCSTLQRVAVCSLFWGLGLIN